MTAEQLIASLSGLRVQWDPNERGGELWAGNNKLARVLWRSSQGDTVILGLKFPTGEFTTVEIPETKLEWVAQ